jgi:molybdopterin-guanine dinucleotide biosynthesis protein B
MAKIPIITVIGYSNSGKTRCVTGLITALTRSGYRVASTKHCHHGFDLDVEGKDSWKHRQAGAVTTLMSSGNRIGMMATTPAPLTLEQICHDYVHGAEILLAEGYSWENFPKILVISQDKLEQERIAPDDFIIALVGERRVDSTLPQFSFNEVEALASLLERDYLLPQFAAEERKEFVTYGRDCPSCLPAR